MSVQDPVKVLVVEDDPYILLSLEFLMKKAGYQVLVARNGTEALEQVRNQLPDLVLLDVSMRDVDGYELCKQISAEPGQKAKLVLLSAKVSEADIRKGLESGASRYISKPFSARDVMKQIRELIAAG